MLQLLDLSLRRGTQVLISHASLQAGSDWKLGLCGANGSGKTSLFALLLGEIEPDDGAVEFPRDWRVGHMQQHIASEDQRLSALDYVIGARPELYRIREALREPDTLDADRITELTARFDELHGYRIEADAARILAGLGFAQDDHHKTVKHFSGGWQMRLNLARALLSDADMLLLDEPTNHLDIDAIIWLEQFLRGFQGLLILISHDREFLDNTVNHIAYIHDGQLKLYKGNYSAFEKQFAEQQMQQQALAKRIAEQRAHMQAFVDRFKAKASKARQAQSRMKALEKLPEIAAVRALDSMHFDFPPALHLSPPLMQLEELQAGYAGNAVVSIDRWTINPGDRIGLLGANGIGKSTLMRTLAGDLPPCHGVRSVHPRLVIGYFAQHMLTDDELDATPLALIRKDKPAMNEQGCRDFLGSWQFQGELQMQPCHALSGGQQARLALARVALQKPAILLLDEPTNHLDMASREALTEALQRFDGAVILVSHDRHLLETSCDTFFRIRGGKLQAFDGNLQDYQAALLAERSAPQTTAVIADRVDRKQARQEAAQKRQQLAPLKRQIKQMEQDLEHWQKTLAGYEIELADESLYLPEQRSRLAEILKQQTDTRKAQEEGEARYLDLLTELEALESALRDS